MVKKIKNGMSYEKNGWKYISIYGKPKERGYAHGYLCAEDFKEIQTMLKFLMMEAYGYDWDFFIKKVGEVFVKNFLVYTSNYFGEKYFIEVLTRKLIDNLVFKQNKLFG